MGKSQSKQKKPSTKAKPVTQDQFKLLSPEEQKDILLNSQPIKLPNFLLFTSRVDSTTSEMVTPPRTNKVNFLHHHRQMDIYPRYAKYLVEVNSSNRMNMSGVFYRGIPMDVTKINETYILVENSFLRKHVKMENKIHIPLPI